MITIDTAGTADDWSPRKCWTTAQELREVLSGETKPSEAFIFLRTPQGLEYWWTRQEQGLDDEARAILEDWIRQLEAEE